MDHQAFIQQQLTEDNEHSERYAFMMRPEPKEGVGPIQTEFDDLLGREMRFRMMTIGMTRNAKPEDKKEVKVYIEPLPHIRIADAKQLQGWYQSKDDPDEGRPRPCFTDAMLTEPYGGFCTVGCGFCYINSGFRGYRGAGVVSVPIHYGAQVKKQLAGMRTSAAGYFSSFTDPFLPLEDYYHNTQQGAEAFVDLGLPIFFLSRLPYPGWAFDLLQRNRYSYMQKSINTPSQADWKRLSPGAASLDEHFAEIREARRRGIYVSIQVNPIIPGVVTHEDVEVLFERLAEAGAHHVIVKFVEAGYSWAPTMVERIVSRFGEERGSKFRDLFTCNIGIQKTVDEHYRLEAHPRYRRAATRLGLTYATCYEYKYERDPVTQEIKNKRGISIGREFATSDQCHGHRVPMFTRDDLAGPFREVAECPPSGCLYCASENVVDGVAKPRCGSELFGAAKALRMPDLRRGVYEKREEAS